MNLLTLERSPPFIDPALMANCSYTVESIVWIEIKNLEAGDLRRFSQWCAAEGIRPVVKSRSATAHVAGYTAEAAERVVEWLRDAGFEERERRRAGLAKTKPASGTSPRRATASNGHTAPRRR